MTSQGAARNLTNTPGVDEDHPAWSPDGQLIAYETDVEAEQQIAVRPVAGGAPRLLTQFHGGYFYTPVWSAAADALAVADANHSLWLLRPQGGTALLIARDPYAEIRDAAFSPNGRWLAYSVQRATGLRALHLRNMASGHDTDISSPMESDRNPAFTSDDRLVFISQRNEQPFVSDRDDETLISTLNSDGLYAVTLDGARSEDLAAVMTHAVALPVTPAVITSLVARGVQLYYQTRPPQLIDGDLAGADSALHALDLATMQDRVVVAGLSSSSLSADGTTVAYRRSGSWWLAPTRPPEAGAASAATKVTLTKLLATVDPRLEWADMFRNAWRLDRDVFFSAAMNGDDWPQVYSAYSRLLPRLGSEDDFLWLLGQMQGELASSHTFMGSGPAQGSADLPVHLGADYTLDPGTGRYRFTHIFRGDATREEFRAPLGALDVQEGEYILAINGHELEAPQSPEQLLAGTLGPIVVAVAATPKAARRELSVEPVNDETALRQLDWVTHNRVRVEQASGGRIGYIYLQDFDAAGSRDFIRQFYPQRDKQGLIIDVRWNLGGFTSQAVLDVLRRRVAGVFVNREGAVSPLPAVTAPGAMVTLMNYASSSDGDQFPFFFRQFGLGPLVGERTWGGVQGINQPWRLADGDFILIPKDALASTDGHWVIENAGVTPDIPVSAAPEETSGGADAQLDRALQTVLRLLSQHPSQESPAPPPLPAYPVEGAVPPANFSDGSEVGKPRRQRARHQSDSVRF